MSNITFVCSYELPPGQWRHFVEVATTSIYQGFGAGCPDLRRCIMGRFMPPCASTWQNPVFWLVKHYKCQQWCSTKATVYLIKSGVSNHVMFCLGILFWNSYAKILTFYIKMHFTLLFIQYSNTWHKNIFNTNICWCFMREIVLIKTYGR